MKPVWKAQAWGRSSAQVNMIPSCFSLQAMQEKVYCSTGYQLQGHLHLMVIACKHMIFGVILLFRLLRADRINVPSAWLKQTVFSFLKHLNPSMYLL